MKHLISLSLLALGFFACNKNNNTTITLQDDINSLNAIFSSNKSATQTFTFDAGLGTSIRTAGGSRYIIPANGLQTANGLSVSGLVNVEITECLKPSSMIFSKVLPVSNGDPLISGGEFMVNFKQGANTLNLKPAAVAEMKLPQFGNTQTGMEIFFGEERKDDPANTVNWQMADSLQGGNTNFIVTNGDTISIFSDSCNIWCNADRFMTSPNYKNFSIHIAGEENIQLGNTYGYAVYDNYNGAWPLSAHSVNFTEGHVPDIPVHFVIFGMYDGKFKAGTLGVTPAEGGNYTVTLSETTPAALKSLVDSF